MRTTRKARGGALSREFNPEGYLGTDVWVFHVRYAIRGLLDLRCPCYYRQFETYQLLRAHMLEHQDKIQVGELDILQYGLTTMPTYIEGDQYQAQYRAFNSIARDQLVGILDRLYAYATPRRSQPQRDNDIEYLIKNLDVPLAIVIGELNPSRLKESAFWKSVRGRPT